MQQDFTLKAYNYPLPPENIAQHPADRREDSRLFILHRQSDVREHRHFSDIVDLLQKGDLLVVNDTKVFPARLLGHKDTGGKAEVFLLSYPQTNETVTDTTDKVDTTAVTTATATALIKSSKPPRPGSTISINADLCCTILEKLGEGRVKIMLHYKREKGLAEALKDHGQIPLPPYIERNNGSTAEDSKRYQTVYASQPGAVAAPTAGLHFSEDLLKTISEKGILIARITLHVGYGTFAPVRTEAILDHTIHQEYVHISKENADTINTVRQRGGKIWAVGTTTVRALEFAGNEQGKVQPTDGWCDLYILPGYRFKVIDNLITNFHLPQSSLLFLVSALCGRERLLDCYRQAIAQGYRFYSYGDAMAIMK
ncbi:MAG: tRNA preQ1(34) S-adenosylmethionine ribosyltransferase-isomerase QueA [Proteobacteria bacterium]|jgi:S-adenosylmethionine:tRNA ribosyltransferase-isomerase|nr:tRNA preQ1(34) S-adenosylmethionine ribosyltransferase-isomerase QueA [Desulfocapsa sp.]MBU3945387.1 tRNA preQ1(34) S-adenosylmethionine ribosyltransferase-isomerase QueA [Pseudomonadota bacterium]MCG2744159.1 tRNA preQ1(34) S-adenosylmethionine ribosyltransferase-isomerase QueA [Desulfobacteraceae bacterium]MBU3984551.1 tRNA preQ1(34) S-adenosylmethionine ribosyltransferase-isomerase QueA [Pseudomonadota bacterium]MBU4028161.1 tRNA preQ1(34) S-adenosylmethionine ribosyltransferase-isomerase